MASSSPNLALHVRLTPTKKNVFMAEAVATGTTASDLVQQFVDYWLGLTDELPERNENVAARVRSVIKVNEPVTGDQ